MSVHKIYFTLILFTVIQINSFCQLLQNGDFENNTFDTTNGYCNGKDDLFFNSHIIDVVSFCPTSPNCEATISDSTCAYGKSYSKRWCLSIAANGFNPKLFDSFSIRIHDSLITGTKYLLQLHMKSGYLVFPYIKKSFTKFGISNYSNQFGSEIGQITPIDTTWGGYSFEFTASFNAKYLTFSQDSTKSNSSFLDKVELSEVLALENNLLSKQQFNLYPQNQSISIISDYSGSLEIYNLTGQSVLKRDIQKGNTELPFTEKQQVYYYVFQTTDGKYAKGKLVMSFESW